MGNRILLVVVLLILSTGAYAWIPQVDFNWTDIACKDGCCSMGGYFSTELTIAPQDRDIYLYRASFLCHDKGFEYEFATLEKYPGAYVAEIETGESETFILDGKIPHSPFSNFKYKVCIVYSISRSGDEGYESCTGWKILDNYGVTRRIECKSNSDCEKTEYCHKESACTTFCKPVSGYCGYVRNHEWVSYECCDNSSCSQNQICVNNTCINLTCECGYLQNHTCVKYECCSDTDCANSRYCYMNECVECRQNTDCAGNEICTTANKCSPLSCRECEHTVNHSCVQYECCDDTDCGQDYRCVTHECQQITTTSFIPTTTIPTTTLEPDTPSDNNSLMIIGFILVLLIAGIFFLVLRK